MQIPLLTSLPTTLGELVQRLTPRSLSSRSSPRDLAVEAHHYAPVDPTRLIPDLELHFLRHALVIWGLLPLFSLLQLVVEPLYPSCETGYSNLAYAGLVLVEIHHIYTEQKSWTMAKQLLTQPEMIVASQLGALRQRRFLVLLSLVSDWDVYNDVTFPMLAHSCGAEVTGRWLHSWRRAQVPPALRDLVVFLSQHLRFWGLALFLAVLEVAVSGVFGLALLANHAIQGGHEFRQPMQTAKMIDQSENRIGGEEFHGLAHGAETANLHSVANLCRMMAAQKEYSFERSASKDEARLKAMNDRDKGKMESTIVESIEYWDQQEQSRVRKASFRYTIVLLVSKVFLGNVIQLWLQASFLALAFTELGSTARCKICISLVVSSFQALVRCHSVACAGGLVGTVITLVIVMFVVWTGLKVFFAFTCKDHIWNISGGCVSLDGSVMPI